MGQERHWTSLTTTMCLILDNLLIPLYIRANLGGELDQTKHPVEGQRNTDFGPAWYPDFGLQMVVNLTILTFRPFLHLLAESVVNKTSRCIKSRCLYRTHGNNQTDNIKYVELNAGPQYRIQNKSPLIVTIVFTAIVFGTAFPVLYAIALFALIVKYLVERYTLAVFYRLPPKFSANMVEMNNSILLTAPVVSLGITYWMFGNRQMFGNEVDAKAT